MSLQSWLTGRAELSGDYYIKLPTEDHGRYARFVVKMVETPDTGDITGILSVTDITEKTITGRIINRLSYSNYDTIVKADLSNDR